MAAASLLRRAIPHLHIHHQHLNTTLPATISLPLRRPSYTTTTTPDSLISKPPSTLSTNDDSNKASLLTEKEDKYFDDYLFDIAPKRYLTNVVQDILHSGRYKDGERLTQTDEKVVVEKLLPQHPHSEDKIGCGIDYIMVDRHPNYRYSRCLFVVRTDGGFEDFSYKKCIQGYKRSSS